MQMNTRVKTILLGAIAALPLFANQAEAQYRIEQDGRLLDASPRLGSGGYNSGGIPYTAYSQGNRIVTGNVTAGREFRGTGSTGLIGGLPLTANRSVYTDPLELRTSVATDQTDAFIRRSYGVTNAAAGQRINESVVFYGRSLATPPPPGAVQQGTTGTYIAPGGVPPYTMSSPFIPQINNQVTTPQITLPRPGELFMPGPLDPQTNRPTYLTASPLGGVRQLRGEDLQGAAMISPSGPNLRAPLNINDPLRLDNSTIRGMQLELRRSAGLGDEETDGATDPARTNNTLPGTGNLAQPLGQPLDTSAASSLTQRPLDNSISATPNPEGVRPGARNRLDLPPGAVPPGRQSAQVAAMERQLEQYYGQRFATAEQENQQFLRQLRARQEAEERRAQQANRANPNDPPAAAADATRPDYREMSRRLLEITRGNENASDTANANANATARERSAVEESIRSLEQRNPRDPNQANTTPGPGSGGPVPTINAPIIRPQPVQIASLAEGIKAEGLAKVMRQAEDLMKQGKYVSALEQYVLAEEVAPNNPLVWLGQAHAELGAGYYLRAADHLRRAFVAEPALMMAQYDLRAMVGQDRLEALVRDLKETAKAQEQDHGLVFLLSYLAYNTNNAQQAGIYLDLAQKRAGGNDEFYRLVRLHWNLPGGDTPTLEDPRIPLSEVYKQFEASNVVSATVTDTVIVAQLKNPTQLPGVTEPARSFRAELPAGATTGPFAKWLRENSHGAKIDFQTRTPATQPVR